MIVFDLCWCFLDKPFLFLAFFLVFFSFFSQLNFLHLLYFPLSPRRSHTSQIQKCELLYNILAQRMFLYFFLFFFFYCASVPYNLKQKILYTMYTDISFFKNRNVFINSKQMSIDFLSFLLSASYRSVSNLSHCSHHYNSPQKAKLLQSHHH